MRTGAASPNTRARTPRPPHAHAHAHARTASTCQRGTSPPGGRGALSRRRHIYVRTCAQIPDAANTEIRNSKTNSEHSKKIRKDCFKSSVEKKEFKISISTGPMSRSPRTFGPSAPQKAVLCRPGCSASQSCSAARCKANGRTAPTLCKNRKRECERGSLTVLL